MSRVQFFRKNITFIQSQAEKKIHMVSIHNGSPSGIYCGCVEENKIIYTNSGVDCVDYMKRFLSQNFANSLLLSGGQAIRKYHLPLND